MSKFFVNFILSSLIALSLSGQTFQQIHKKAILVDTHNDVLSSVTMKGMNMDDDLTGKTHTDVRRFKQGGVDVEIFSIFCDERFGKDTAYKFANIEIDSLYAIVKRNPGRMEFTGTLAQVDHAIKQDHLAVMMGVEGGHMMEDDLNRLDSFYSRGVRYMTLTWNNSTSWATSAKDESQATVTNAKKGLNDFGRDVVRRMNKLGMIVDISHVGEQTFWDAINTTTKPVMASHSSVYALCPVFRNLKDDQIKAVAKNGGVIQVNFYSGFIDSNYSKRVSQFTAAHQQEYDSLASLKRPDYEIKEFFSKKYPAEAAVLRPPLSMLIDHIDYIVKLVGPEYVGLGSDFDGIESAPQGLEGVQDFPKITEALLKRGYTVKNIEKILGGNFLRVFKANQPDKN